MRLSCLFAALLVLAVVPALAGDDADVADLARRYVSEDAAARRSAEEEVAKAPAHLLRGVLRHVRSARGREDATDRAPDAPESPSKKAVRLDARFLQMTEAAARDHALLDAGGRVGARVLSEAEQRRLLDAVTKGVDVTQITAPSITVYDRHRAEVTVLDQKSYVKDFDVVETGGAWVADPVIGTVVSGVILEMTPRVTPDESEVLVDLRLVVSDVVQPMEEHALELRGSTVRIQMPEVRGWKLDRRVAVPDGRTIVVGGSGGLTPLGDRSAAAAGLRLVVLLTAEHTPAELPDGLIPPGWQPVPPPRRELPDSPGGPPGGSR